VHQADGQMDEDHRRQCPIARSSYLPHLSYPVHVFYPPYLSHPHTR